MNQQNIV